MNKIDYSSALIYKKPSRWVLLQARLRIEKQKRAKNHRLKNCAGLKNKRNFNFGFRTFTDGFGNRAMAHKTMKSVLRIKQTALSRA